MIREACKKDISSIRDIYNHYILHSVISFEEKAVSQEEMVSRLEKIQSTGLYWLVYEEAGDVKGFAYASLWNERCAYNKTVEVSIYLDHKVQGKGYGSALYQALFALLKSDSVHSVIAGIALPNAASIALHEKFGMEQVAHFKEVGFKFGQWLDVGYWQVQLGHTLP